MKIQGIAGHLIRTRYIEGWMQNVKRFEGLTVGQCLSQGFSHLLDPVKLAAQILKRAMSVPVQFVRGPSIGLQNNGLLCLD